MFTIVFDLDGTLVDTAPDLIDTLNVILEREQLPPVAYENARPMIGGGARRMIERALVADGNPATQSDVDRMFSDFIDYYAAHIADRSRPFPMLVRTLDQLTASGYRLAVCTNKIECLAVKLLNTLELSKHFACICGQDTFGVMKPDPAILLDTIKRASGDPRRTIMVGDSGTDIRTAQNAKVPVVAVDFGYTEAPLQSYGPDRIISSYEDLPGALEGLRIN